MNSVYFILFIDSVYNIHFSHIVKLVCLKVCILNVPNYITILWFCSMYELNCGPISIKHKKKNQDYLTS